jgi:hypothetical protein
MKKLLSIIFILSLCVVLFSCNNEEPLPDQTITDNPTESQASTDQPTESPTEKPKATQDSENPRYAFAISKETLDAFSSYLDEMKILPDRTQEEFAEQLATYSHKGEALTGEYSDRPYGKLYSIAIEDRDQPYYQHFTFYHTVADKEETVDLSLGFPIENFDLPFGINFDDTMTTALVKLGITRIEPFSTFLPDNDNPYRMTLYKDDTCRLAYMSYDADSPCNDTILYTENYTYTDEQGREVNVTRSVELYFFIGFFNEPEYVTNLAIVEIEMSKITK